jgi:hypothetical protein
MSTTRLRVPASKASITCAPSRGARAPTTPRRVLWRGVPQKVRSTSFYTSVSIPISVRVGTFTVLARKLTTWVTMPSSTGIEHRAARRRSPDRAPQPSFSEYRTNLALLYSRPLIGDTATPFFLALYPLSQISRKRTFSAGRRYRSDSLRTPIIFGCPCPEYTAKHANAHTYRDCMKIFADNAKPRHGSHLILPDLLNSPRLL